MALRNRVDPFGALIETQARGLFMGNRGGRFHRDDRTLSPSDRCWVSRRWICCALAFKGRRRAVWGRSYTELFFLDEVTALAAGHRPCFECRRDDAMAFANAWGGAFGLQAPPRAETMDARLHAERLQARAERVKGRAERVKGGGKRHHRRSVDELPDGAIIACDGRALALRDGALWPWTPMGYGAPEPLPPREQAVDVLTPPAILGVLAAGYRPRWHPSLDVKKLQSLFQRA